ncbi:branched-chain amino acid transport system II carrier protein [Tetragenococcus halophilus]|uniref:Branched-chain amino acid transport system carrier protein n=1 Tax=Tetragenococcus halophilus TaxID=51669 RepID=A0AB35HMX8_TETHA|nr:branched-chain amino acid transport system II carrier protein [Tetragenococcus halophilus]MCO8296713.1 branched-chain amino acid transport system II carrier protein [Tetragenococcus halophilus]MCO8297593.1 branched-chain amino acid transport system II carrier protein [Tetragenococcus halophilus]
MTNKSNKITSRQILFIGLMVFSLFFGAGNLIFPAGLGSEAGENLWRAMAGFLITGVALPVLGLVAIANVSEDGNTESLAIKVHPTFAKVLTIITYLSIGPLMAAPRTGLVSFEIGISPFLNQSNSEIGLLIYSIAFFGLVYYLALYPSKFMDRFGRIVTPVLLLILGVFIVTTIFNPMSDFQLPQGQYAQAPFSSGVKEGYLTMDTIVSIVFATIIINTTKDLGEFNQTVRKKVILKAGTISAILLAFIYLGIAHIGASSSTLSFSSGADILAGVANNYFGSAGNFLFGLVVIFACLPTGVGLLSSCAWYFNKRFPRITYKKFLLFFVLFSATVANIGLEKLIQFSVPVLNVVYPVIIALILLSFINKYVSCDTIVYRSVVGIILFVSLNDGLKEFNSSWDYITPFVTLPFSDLGFSWIIPAVVVGVIAKGISFAWRK